MASVTGWHYWIVSSIFVFSVTSAAIAQDQDVFDLFLKPQRAKAAPPSQSVHRPRRDSQHVPGHESGDAASIFGLFVPYQTPRVQSRRTPQPSAQARAPAKSFEPPKVRSKRETPLTPRLAAIVKPKPVIAAPKKTFPEPPSEPTNISLVKPRPRPVPPPARDARKYDCEQARAIIGKYAFGNIQAKSCEGDVYSFAAMRSGKPFVVKISALNGELLEVRKASD
jgi:hypothetical protein